MADRISSDDEKKVYGHETKDVDFEVVPAYGRDGPVEFAEKADLRYSAESCLNLAHNANTTKARTASAPHPDDCPGWSYRHWAVPWLRESHRQCW